MLEQCASEGIITDEKLGSLQTRPGMSSAEFDRLKGCNKDSGQDLCNSRVKDKACSPGTSQNNAARKASGSSKGKTKGDHKFTSKGKRYVPIGAQPEMVQSADASASKRIIPIGAHPETIDSVGASKNKGTIPIGAQTETIRMVDASKSKRTIPIGAQPETISSADAGDQGSGNAADVGISERSVYNAVVTFMKDHGGSKLTDLEALYECHPHLRHYIEGIGGWREFCNMQEDLKWRNGGICYAMQRGKLPTAPLYHPDVQRIIAKLTRATQCFLDECKVYAFGSSANHFGDGSSDVDLVMVLPYKIARPWLGEQGHGCMESRILNKMVPLLKRNGFNVIAKVLHARIPILKLQVGGRDCDLSCNNALAVFNTQLLRMYAQLDFQVVRIVKEVKQWAIQNSVHGASHSQLSSYSFTLLVIAYFQAKGALPCLQQDVDPEIYSEQAREFNVAMNSCVQALQPSADVSFAGFLHFYTTEFKWGSWVVSVRTGKCDDVKNYPNLACSGRCGSKQEPNLIHIEDPFDIERDLSSVLGPGQNERLWRAMVEAATEISLQT